MRSDPQSMFVQNLICQRVLANGHAQLRGKVLHITKRGETSERCLESAGELTDVLATQFWLDEPAAAGLWPKICARHAELFG